MQIIFPLHKFYGRNKKPYLTNVSYISTRNFQSVLVDSSPVHHDISFSVLYTGVAGLLA